MLVPACPGFKETYYNDVQNKRLKLGFVTLRVDYLAARNAKNCLKVPTSEVADDIYIAAKYLTLQPFVKKEPLISLGGRGVVQVHFKHLNELKIESLPRLALLLPIIPTARESSLGIQRLLCWF